MDKNTLRLKYKDLRTKLDAEEIEAFSMDIANNVLQLDIWKHSNYHIFLPIAIQKEVNTEYILHILQGKDKNVIVPKSNFDTGTLEHILLTDSTKLAQNSWGISEPTAGISVSADQIDVVFVPLLAYDIHGNRVGYGKGFYDNFLGRCRNDTLKIGLSFFQPENTISNSFEKDISLDYCVIPTQTFKF